MGCIGLVAAGAVYLSAVNHDLNLDNAFLHEKLQSLTHIAYGGI